MTAYGQEPDIPNLAEVILRHGETYAAREIVHKGKQPYDVLMRADRVSLH